EVTRPCTGHAIAPSAAGGAAAVVGAAAAAAGVTVGGATGVSPSIWPNVSVGRSAGACCWASSSAANGTVPGGGAVTATGAAGAVPGAPVTGAIASLGMVGRTAPLLGHRGDLRTFHG